MHRTVPHDVIDSSITPTVGVYLRTNTPAVKKDTTVKNLWVLLPSSTTLEADQGALDNLLTLTPMTSIRQAAIIIWRQHIYLITEVTWFFYWKKHFLIFEVLLPS